jgi:hypothetical protein
MEEDLFAAELPQSCSDCSFYGKLTAERRGTSPMVPGCEIRKTEIADSVSSWCANHTRLTDPSDHIPVGPVWSREGARTEILVETPDTQKVRNHLLNILERVDACSFDELSERERSAIWQTKRFGDRRATVHLDRIESDFEVDWETEWSRERWSFIEESADRIVQNALSRTADAEGVQGDDRVDDDDPANWIELFTVQGRMLILSTIVVGAVAVFLLFTYLMDTLPNGFPVPSVVFILIATAASVGYLKFGLWGFRRLGIRFFSAASRDSEDPA